MAAEQVVVAELRGLLVHFCAVHLSFRVCMLQLRCMGCKEVTDETQLRQSRSRERAVRRGAVGVRCRARPRLYLDRRRLVLGGRTPRLASGTLGSPATGLPLGASHLAARG